MKSEIIGVLVALTIDALALLVMLAMRVSDRRQR